MDTFGPVVELLRFFESGLRGPIYLAVVVGTLGVGTLLVFAFMPAMWVQLSAAKTLLLSFALTTPLVVPATFLFTAYLVKRMDEGTASIKAIVLALGTSAFVVAMSAATMVVLATFLKWLFPRAPTLLLFSIVVAALSARLAYMRLRRKGPSMQEFARLIARIAAHE